MEMEMQVFRRWSEGQAGLVIQADELAACGERWSRAKSAMSVWERIRADHNLNEVVEFLGVEAAAKLADAYYPRLRAAMFPLR